MRRRGLGRPRLRVLVAAVIVALGGWFWHGLVTPDTSVIARTFHSLELPADFHLVAEHRTGDSPWHLFTGLDGDWPTVDRYYAADRTPEQLCSQIPDLLGHWARRPEATSVHYPGTTTLSPYRGPNCWFGGTLGRYQMSGTVAYYDEVPASVDELHPTPITVAHNAVLMLSVTAVDG